jgi:outer membrane protein OmpA-like peptidoglycan-associated protein
MTWRSQERTTGRLPIVAATLLSSALLCSAALAQGSPDVVVNYDALNSLSAPPAAPSTTNSTAQPSSQYVPGYGSGYPAPPPYSAYSAATLPPPPPGALSSVLTTLGPDGRPVAPIKLKKPGSRPETKQSEAAAGPSDAAIAAATPPPEPVTLPATVPMPAPTPAPPAPGVTAQAAPVGAVPASSATVVQAPAAAPPEPEPPAAQQASPEPEPQMAQPPPPEPAPQQQASAEQAAAPAQQSATQQEAAKAPEEPAATPAPQDGTGEAQPAEETSAPPPEPENSQPAPPVPQGGIRIVYPVDLNDVPPEANTALDDLASQMQADESMRIQIKCYASGTEDTESKARRKSLARCISIRQYLFKKDIRTTRMDVRALGLKSEGQPADRVDIVPATS